MQIFGVILIVIVLGLYGWWLWYTKNQQAVGAKVSAGVQTFNIVVKGVYSPSVIKAKAGQLIRINFIRQESTDCSRFVNFPDFKIRQELPRGKTVTVELTPERKGEYSFVCDMSMYQGRLIVE